MSEPKKPGKSEQKKPDMTESMKLDHPDFRQRPLGTFGEGDRAILDIIDSDFYGGNGKKDGRITKDELQRYLKNDIKGDEPDGNAPEKALLEKMKALPKDAYIDVAKARGVLDKFYADLDKKSTGTVNLELGIVNAPGAKRDDGKLSKFEVDHAGLSPPSINKNSQPILDAALVKPTPSR